MKNTEQLPQMPIWMVIFLLLPLAYIGFVILVSHIILLLNWIGIKQDDKLLAKAGMNCLPTLILFFLISCLFNNKWFKNFKDGK
jgi:hypothetical protein